MSSKKRSNGREYLVLKVGQMEFTSAKFSKNGGAPLEEIGCHQCERIPDVMYPLHRKCEGYGLCEDCAAFDFFCQKHRTRVPRQTLKNGQLNHRATKLFISCPVCSEPQLFLKMQSHICDNHPEQLLEKGEDVCSTSDVDMLEDQADSKHSQKDRGTQNTCCHCNEKWEKEDLEEHEKACPEKVVPCRDCGHQLKQGEINEHKENCKKKRCTFCSQYMTETEFASHETTCDQKPIECFFKKYGCTKEGTRDVIENHQENESHAAILLPVIWELQKRLEQVEPPMDVLLSRLERLV